MKTKLLSPKVIGVLGGLLFPLSATTALWAQEVDQFSAPNAVGVGMVKGLHQQLGGGTGNANTAGSSRFLIARDPARAVRRGRNLFQRKFQVGEGQGPRTNDGNGDINTIGSIGAGLADSCAACHGRPRGSAGFGGDVFTRPDSRDAPHLFGLGLQEQLADEMTTELREIRDAAVDLALNGSPGAPLSTTQNRILNADTIGDWTVGTAGSRVATPGGGIGVRTSGGWTEINSANLGDLPAVASTLKYNFRMPSAPPWGEISVVVLAPSQGIFWSELTPRVQLNTLAVGTNNTVSFPIPPALQTSLNSATDVSVKIIINAPNLPGTQRYTFDNIVMTNVGTPPGPVTANLIAKGISFGTIAVDAMGVVNTAGVQGVNPDLRIRPFFAEGTTVSMREFAVGAFNAEMGIQINDPVIDAAAAGGSVITPSGMVLDGTIDVFESSPNAETTDPSDNEPTHALMSNADAGEALSDFMEFYLLNYFKPGHYKETTNSLVGRSTFNSIGCNTCHKADFVVDSDRRVADVETDYDPVNGVFNNLFATAATRFNVVPSGGVGGPLPFIVPAGNSFVVEDIFTDFKRHDMGTALYERNFDNTIHKTFITEPLWGVGSSAPYGHDGRSINLQEIILRHGGEGLAAKNAYVALSAQQQSFVQEFLNTLILFPPDDTASNLNAAADINRTHPDFPQRFHGNIKLPTLFQDPSEGAE